MKNFVSIGYLAAGSLLIVLLLLFQNNTWVAPPEADKLSNPKKGNEQATREGKKIYEEVCWICHGDKGNGKGPASVGLTPPPADFLSSRVQGQSDGALFWKISEGKGAMTSYKDKYSESQRWSLVNYIRQIAKEKVASSSR